MTKKYRFVDGTSEGGEIRHDVVDGGNKSPVHDMGDSYENTTREGDVRACALLSTDWVPATRRSVTCATSP